jgi:hypothetical protein
MSDGHQAWHAVILLDSPESRFGRRRPSFHQGQHLLGKQRKLARLVSHRPEMHPLAADSCIPNEEIDAMLGRTYAHPRSELVNIAAQGTGQCCEYTFGVARGLGDP